MDDPKDVLSNNDPSKTPDGDSQFGSTSGKTLRYASDLVNITRSAGLGQFDRAIFDTFYGHNYRGTGNAVPANTDQYGYTFFTKPCLNLSYDNLSANRLMNRLLTNEPATVYRAIRSMLDPRAALRNGISSPLTDSYLAFMPLLSNHLTSLSGWPDKVMDFHTSKAGVLREEHIMPDGTTKIYNSFDLTANFDNIKGDPITLLFESWLEYMSETKNGNFDPYRDLMIENEMDCTTRIYRFVLDPTRRFVQKWCACGASIPAVAPVGSVFNFSKDKPYNSDHDQISIQFKTVGAEYNDPITIKEFNDTVIFFNAAMEDGKREKSFTRLSVQEQLFFNSRGYPRVDPDTFAFEVWLPNEVYQAEVGSLIPGVNND